MPTETQEIPSQTQEKPTAKIILGDFRGAFKAFANTAFVDLKCVGVDEQTAHKIASDFASDVGRAMATSEDLRAKVGKCKDKDNSSRLSLSGKSDYVLSSNAMKLIRIVQVIEQLKTEKLCTKRVDIHDVDLIPALAEYLEQSEVWATEQVWEEKAKA